MCTEIKGSSRDLCNSLAALARRICFSYVDPSSVASLLASRLMAFSKNPGVHPIGISEIARRFISKGILFVARPDVQEALECLQMCGGQISGIEATVHAVRSAFESVESEAALLVDASYHCYRSCQHL